MSYLVLARKWRPKSFDDVIGQEYIIQALRNAVESGRVAHALIFSGPRGIGKTTTARIIAMCLNCSDGPTTSPCKTCNYCKEIAEGKSLDVIEIDAASHTGVKDIREIIENIKYLPSSGKTKVYIIDETHMLSQSAFNALLKTLEEPPSHVKFILATTEIHKIPITILSRCQRYDFKKVSTDKIKERIHHVTSSEGIKISDETLYMIAQESDGSIRDALSLLDQIIATFGYDIKYDDVVSTLGVPDKTLVRETLNSIFAKDAKKSIELLNLATQKGVNPKRFSEDLLRTLRNMVIIKACGKETVSGVSEDEKNKLALLLRDKTLEYLETLFGVLLKGAEEVHGSFYPHMSIEMTLIKLSLIDTSIPIDDILTKINSIYEKISENPESGNKIISTTSEIKKPLRTEPVENRELIVKENNNSVNTGIRETKEFIEYIKSKKPVIAMRLENAESINQDKSTISIEFSSKSSHYDYLRRKETLNFLQDLSEEFYGSDVKLEIRYKNDLNAGNDIKTIREQNDIIREEIKKDPVVQEAINIFDGHIVNIQINEKE